MSVEKLCRVCGQSLPPYSGRGRRREFHDDCKCLFYLLGWMEGLIMETKFTPEKAKDLRSRFFYLSNLLNGSRTLKSEQLPT